MSTIEEVLTKLLLESKAANEELYAALAPVVRADGASDRGKGRRRVTDAEMQRYVEALRRFDAISAKIRAFSKKADRPRTPEAGAPSPRRLPAQDSMSSDLSAVEAALAELSEPDLHGLIAATKSTPRQCAPDLMGWIESICDWEMNGRLGLNYEFQPPFACDTARRARRQRCRRDRNAHVLR
jgi:hypothetical protein